MALNISDYWSDLNYSFEKSWNKWELVIFDSKWKEHLFLLDIKEVIPTDKNRKPTISKQDIKRKRGIYYSVTIDSIKWLGISISTPCLWKDINVIVEGLSQELFFDMETRYKKWESSNEIGLFVDLAEKRAMERLEK